MSVGAVLFSDDACAQQQDVEPDSSPPSTQRSTGLATSDAGGTGLAASLDKAMALEGAIAVALADYDSGEVCDVRNTRPNFDIAAATVLNAQVIRSKMSLLKALGISDSIGDISISCEAQHHIMRLLNSGHRFLYLAIDRRLGNLGMARHSLAQIERELHL